MRALRVFGWLARTVGRIRPGNTSAGGPLKRFSFSQRSQRALSGVHPDLVKVAYRALELTTVDFVIVEGVRSIETQRRYVAEGKSRTLYSRHLSGHAIDYIAFVDGKGTYDAVAMKAVSVAFKRAGKELGVAIEWGGDWKSFVDTPHIELSAKQYPKP